MWNNYQKSNDDKKTGPPIRRQLEEEEDADSDMGLSLDIDINNFNYKDYSPTPMIDRTMCGCTKILHDDPVAKDIRHDVGPADWGPGGWAFLEHKFQWGSKFTSESLEDLSNFYFKLYTMVIPGERCRRNFIEHVQTYESKFKLNADRAEWVYALHSKVSKRKGQQVYDTMLAKETWSGPRAKAVSPIKKDCIRRFRSTICYLRKCKNMSDWSGINVINSYLQQQAGGSISRNQRICLRVYSHRNSTLAILQSASAPTFYEIFIYWCIEDRLDIIKIPIEECGNFQSVMVPLSTEESAQLATTLSPTTLFAKFVNMLQTPPPETKSGASLRNNSSRPFETTSTGHDNAPFVSAVNHCLVKFDNHVWFFDFENEQSELLSSTSTFLDQKAPNDFAHLGPNLYTRGSYIPFGKQSNMSSDNNYAQHTFAHLTTLRKANNNDNDPESFYLEHQPCKLHDYKYNVNFSSAYMKSRNISLHMLEDHVEPNILIFDANTSQFAYCSLPYLASTMSEYLECVL